MNYETPNYSGNLECQRYSKLEGFRLAHCAPDTRTLGTGEKIRIEVQSAE